ncbi:MAG: cobaltochelatase subunit CobN [Syntrophales bacterium]|jgi:cobaltochelatase CobN|nr:cobaltochelatase subunit CobN [Syntrophales bacterium]MDY0043715.1 cobaltochelatase subunit CobN [Syntrophales bacterium]
MKDREPIIEEFPWIGLYHNSSDRVFCDIDEYRAWHEAHICRRGDSGYKGIVGIFFPHSLLVKKDLKLIDSLIGALEERMILPVPLFAKRKEYAGPDVPDAAEALAGFRGVDLIINCESSFLLQKDPEKAANGTILETLNVPVVQTVYSSGRTEEEWRSHPQGIQASGQIYWVAQPEFNGVIEPVVTSARDTERDDPYGFRKPIAERIEYLMKRVDAWLKLGRLPARQRRVTFLLHKNPCAGSEAAVAGGAGLDTLESVVRIMRRMREEGYDVRDCPENGEALVRMIMERKALCEFRWTTVDEIVTKGGAVDLIDPDRYLGWLDELPPDARKKVIDAWGEPPGEAMVHKGMLVVTGVRFGKIHVLVEPKRGCYGARCDGKVCKILHDPTIAPTHHCLATYAWARENSDVMVSMGTHGYIEFLPGKGVGLSGSCFPEIIVGAIPHLYLYTVKNCSEGIIAKRRAYATLVDHLGPTVEPSGLSDEMEELDDLLTQCARADDFDEEHRKDVLVEEIRTIAERANLVEKGRDISSDEMVSVLHEKLNLFRETQIGAGLHVFGQAPDEDRIAHMLVSIMRFDSDRPSIRRLILEIMGYRYDYIIDHQESLIDGMTGGQHLDRATDYALELVPRVLREVERIRDHIADIIPVRNPGPIDSLVELLTWAIRDVVPKLAMTGGEISQLLRGMDAHYIQPGASGLITRGKIDVLPTGRNFYSVDTRAIPTRAAWAVGMKMAHNLLHRYLHEEGRYPENLGMVLWAVDAFRADGEQIAQILYLMGARPVWSEAGQVMGTEPIPLKELGRPRIDVTIRTSGIFRDNLSHLIELIDRAVNALASLNEREEYNYIRKHVNAYRVSRKDGESEDEKTRRATYRIFCSQPGAYGGGGINYMIASSAWETTEDLGEHHIEHGGYAYGEGTWGRISRGEYADRLSTVDATYNKLSSDESDPLDCCCFYDFQGGMTAAVKTVAHRDPKVYWGDTRDPHRPETRHMKDEMERVARTKLLNPHWIEHMKGHGYRGAGDIAKRVGRVYGWDASAEVVSDWIFDDIARTFVLDRENRKFFEDHNPWALEEMTRRLLEAESRGMWKADTDVLEKLRDRYLEIEGWMEESMGDTDGDFQGGSVDVITKRHL